ncbi:MAG TPA: tellurite resistance TerB family protein [Chitinophagaceae bacterium]|nr:tellurite resistance TerB family protein [Chitinophagaceae bacterium]
MGLFDKIFSSNSATQQKAGYTPLSDYEAWVAILYTCISVDGDVSDVEIDVMMRLLIYKNKFADIEIIPFYKNAMYAKNEFGAQHIIDQSAPLIKEEDRPTVLALVTELVLSDGILTEKEKELIEYVTLKLNIDEALASKIIEVTLIKNRDNRVLVN